MRTKTGVSKAVVKLSVCIVAAVAVAGLLESCGTTRTFDFSSYVYPPPPDTARLRLVDVYHSAEDLGKSALSVLAGESNDNGLREPSGVAFDSHGNIVVADLYCGIVVVNRKTHETQRIRSGPMRAPVSVAMDSRDNYYVADSRANAVYVLDSAGEFRKTLGRPSMFEMPVGIALDEKRGRVYVSDTKRNAVFVLNFNGDSTGVIGMGDTTLDFNKPTYLTVDSTGNLFITDVLNFRIVKVSPEGKKLIAFGKAGDSYGEFQRPRGLAIDRDGHLWIADARNNNLQIFSPTGQLLTFVGQFGEGAAEFKAPAGVCSDGRFVAVVDQLNKRVQLFEYLGDPAATPAK